PLLKEEEFGLEDKSGVAEFFRKAQSAAGGSEWRSPIHFVQVGEPKSVFGHSRQMRIPAGIRSADLFLARLPSALVVAATVARFRSDPIDELFARDHEGSFEIRELSIAYGMVEEAKQSAIANAVAPAAATGVLPEK